MTNTMTRTNTWDAIGVDLNTSKLSEALTKSGLDYEVASQPVFTQIGDQKIKIDGRVCMVRNNDNHVYGIVSDRYVPIQNKDAFDFINYIDEDIEFVKAGETFTGMIYIIGKLKDMNILGDKFTTYVIFQNSHNGRYQLATSICPLRIVCQNQFNLSFKESNSTFIIRHTKNIESKMAIAADTLKNISNYMTIFNEKAQLFAQQKITEHNLTKFINFMFPTNEEMSQRVLDNIEEEKTRFVKAYMSDDNRNFKGTAWGLLNGVTDYLTHKEYKRKVENLGEKRFMETILVTDRLNDSMQYISELV